MRHSLARAALAAAASIGLSGSVAATALAHAGGDDDEYGIETLLLVAAVLVFAVLVAVRHLLDRRRNGGKERDQAAQPGDDPDDRAPGA